MDKLPEAGRAELEDRERQIDGGVIVHQPARHDPEQRFCDRQLADRGRSMEKKQFHARSVSRTVRFSGTGNYGAVKQFEEVCRIADI